MASTRGFLGRLTAERAIKLVLGTPGRLQSGLQPRIGKRVILDAPKEVIAGAQQPAQAEMALQNWRNWIYKLEARKQTSTRQLELGHQRELLKFLEKVGQRPLTAYQLTAILAFQPGFGLDREKLLSAVNKLLGVEHRRPEMKTWTGSFSQIGAALRKGLPHRVEQLLYNQKRILDTREIADELELEWNHTTNGYLNAALQLLNQAKLVEKELMHSRGGKASSLATWSHRAHGGLPIRHPNAKLEILEALYQKISGGGENVITLVDSGRPAPGNAGNVGARYSQSAISSAAQELVGEGLATVQKASKEVRTKKGTYRPYETRIKLSPAGMELMKKFYGLGRKSFPELLRQLLGTKRIGETS